MAALTGAWEANDKAGRLIAYNVGADKRIHRGGLVVIDDATGYAEPAADAAAKTFAGVAMEPADNAGGAAGAVSVRLWKEGTYVYDLSGMAATQAVIGKKVCAVDDHTVGLATTTNADLVVGVIVGVVGGTQARIRIDNAVS